MCGIIAYTGSRAAIPILHKGLERLEYRGYDSAGIFAPEDGLFRSVGKVANLAATLPTSPKSTSGIAHTRWATHGAPEERNAHPHGSNGKTLYLVHNGIIENYRELKEDLLQHEHRFTSDTDSEVLAHVIGRYAELHDNAHALTEALGRVRGTYGIAVMFKNEPGVVYAAALGSPLSIGVGENEMWVASDPSAVVEYTQRIVHLEDGEYAVVRQSSYEVRTLRHDAVQRAPTTVDGARDILEKKGYLHFMLKELNEVPTVVENALRGRLQPGSVSAKLGGLEDVEKDLRKAERLTVVGCGSAYYAGLYGKHVIEELTGLPVDVCLASEERYRSPVIRKNEVLLAVSQSGETADTIAALKEARRRGDLTLGVVNVVGSTIARLTDAGSYTHAGPEIGVASTKAFIAQCAVLALVALRLGKLKHAPTVRLAQFAHALREVPHLVEKVLERAPEIEKVAKKYAASRDFLYIGRKYNAGIAHEGALKLKEVSYVHAEAYAAGEMKHGPLAMIDPAFPTVAIAPRDSMYEKMVSNMQEIKARGGPIIMLASDDDQGAGKVADDVLYLPVSDEAVYPLTAAVTLQLFAYYLGVAKGYDVDKPRNLAKSVTVE